MKEIVSTAAAPAAVGPYSQAVIAGNLVFASGQIALVPATGKLAGDDIETQTRQALDNLKAVLEAAGASLADVVKTTVFITDMGDFVTVNRIYKTYFTENPPARSCVEVGKLPAGALVEVEAVALKG